MNISPIKLIAGPILLLVLVSSASAVDYTFTGTVFNTIGVPIDGESVDVRYVYQFEGIVLHEGRATVLTNSSGAFSLTRDITNIWGDGDIVYVEAWATCRTEEKHLDAAYPGTPNFIGRFEFQHTKPGGPDDPFTDIGKSKGNVEPVSWSAVKARFQ